MVAFLVLILSILLVAISRRLQWRWDYTHSAHSGAEGQTAMNLLCYTTGLLDGKRSANDLRSETRQDQLEQRTGQRAGVKNNSLRDQMRRDVLRRARIYGPRLLVGIAVTVQLLSWAHYFRMDTRGTATPSSIDPIVSLSAKPYRQRPTNHRDKKGAAAFGSGRKSMRKLLEQRVTPTEMADQAGRNAARMQFVRNTSLEGGSAIGSIRGRDNSDRVTSASSSGERDFGNLSRKGSGRTSAALENSFSSVEHPQTVPETTRSENKFTDSKGGTHETIDKSEIHEPSVQRKRDILPRSDRNSTRHENLAGISHNPLLGMWVLGLVTFCVLFTDSYGGVARIAILFSDLKESYSDIFEEPTQIYIQSYPKGQYCGDKHLFYSGERMSSFFKKCSNKVGIILLENPK